MAWWHRKRKIATMPGVRLTPTVILARTLEKAQAGRIKSVYIAIEWDENADGSEGGFEGDWSSMTPGDLLCHSKVLDKVATNAFFGIPTTTDEIPTGKGAA